MFISKMGVKNNLRITTKNQAAGPDKGILTKILNPYGRTADSVRVKDRKISLLNFNILYLNVLKSTTVYIIWLNILINNILKIQSEFFS